MNRRNKVIIATRGSKLALWQAKWVKGEIEKNNPGIEVELKTIKTTGDKILDVPLAKVGGKGLFVKEIEDTLLKGEADLAVHSMKDMPTDLPSGLHIAAICRREDPRDALIVRAQSTEHRTQSTEHRAQNTEHRAQSTEHRQRTVRRLRDLPHGARVGTSSLRRVCQLLSARPDLEVTQLRGNLDTRIRKLEEGQFDAIVVAVAGLKRLGMISRATEILSPEISLPAIGQGAIGVESRIDDEFITHLLSGLDHRETSVCIKAERAFLRRLEGGCQLPIAAYAVLEHSVQTAGQGTQVLKITGLVGNLSGDTIIRGTMRGTPEEAESVGTALAEDLLSRGAGGILSEVYGT
jgi:hydroxymethylbilane synthase